MSVSRFMYLGAGLTHAHTVLLIVVHTAASMQKENDRTHKTVATLERATAHTYKCVPIDIVVCVCGKFTFQHTHTHIRIYTQIHANTWCIAQGSNRLKSKEN